MSVKRRIAVVAAGLLTGAALLSGGATALASANTGAVNLSASGTGEQEFPAGTGEEGATATGSFQLTPAGALTYTVRVAGNSEPVAAGHIHEGAAGVNGPVVVPLSEVSINAGTSNTVQIDAALAARIIANPAGFYLNTHSASFSPPTGVARGQLTAAAGAPAVINTGTGGQAADGAGGTTVLAVTAGLGVLVAAGAVAVARRRTTGSAS